MAEADPDQFLLAPGQGDDIVMKLSDPGFVIIDAGFTAGDYIGVAVIDILRIVGLGYLITRKR